MGKQDRLKFKGNWPDEFDKHGVLTDESGPLNWERFKVCLYGVEAGDFIDDPKEVRATLRRAGLTVCKISDVRGA